jgi:hypothetical protein
VAHIPLLARSHRLARPATISLGGDWQTMNKINVLIDNNVCEYARHDEAFSRTATPENPVLWIEHDGDHIWRCLRCTIAALEAAPERECDNCGTSLADGAFCDASCAMSYGYDGGHDCWENVDGIHDECGSVECSYCGDTARYCSADHAVRNGDEVTCYECGKQIREADKCAEHRTQQPAVLAAASNITQPNVETDHDGNVVSDGIEFRF